MENENDIEKVEGNQEICVGRILLFCQWRSQGLSM